MRPWFIKNGWWMLFLNAALVYVDIQIVDMFRVHRAPAVSSVQIDEQMQTIYNEAAEEIMPEPVSTPKVTPDDQVIRAVQPYFPAREIEIISEVAREYNLTTHQTKLLFVIRKIENGRPGLEFGVGDGIPKHPARRYAGQFEESLRVQAQWAAGTITKRYKGNLQKFAVIYCERASLWHTNAKKWLTKIG
jgi:hypothetical protein